MCDLVENYAKECAAKAAAEAAAKAAEEAVAEAKDSALRLFQNGASHELVRASIISLSDEELQAIYRNAMKGE